MLINCVAYKDGQRLADLELDQIGDYLKIPGCFVWVALRDATKEELVLMQHEFGLPWLAIEDALHGNQRPKIQEFGELIHAVMHLVEVESIGDLRVGEVHAYVGPNFVLSVRNRSSKGFLGVRERAEREPGLLKQGSAFVLYALMDEIVDRYFPVIEKLEAELDAIEDQIFERGAGQPNVKRLYELKRRLSVLHHAVAPLLEAVGKLHGGRVPPVCAQSEHYFRDIDDHLRRIDASIGTMRDTIGVAIQVNLSMVMIEGSETTKRLAAWAGIFGVATAFAGIWGMNFEHMPELELPWGYPASLAVIVGSCILLYQRFRHAGWL